MTRNFTFSLLLVLSGISVFGKQVPVSDARQVAVNFYFERINQYKLTDIHDLKITDTFTTSSQDTPLYYIFNFRDKGFVIVSADDAVKPVPGYSLEGNYSKENSPPQFVAWMKQYEDQIRYAKTNNVQPTPKIKEEWEHLLTGDPSRLAPFRKQRSVEPLITSKWNQSPFYNDMCPPVTGGHCVAGCVPVAMGQILYYYRWPDHGAGSYSYDDPPFGTLHASFDSTWYQWNNMTNSVTMNNPGVAELLYHLGVSCDLVYGASSSGMFNHKSAYALKTFFKYSPQTQYVFRDSTTMNWDSLIIAHLDRKMPLYYAGWSVPWTEGHAFVCDGYQDTTYFHFNWGWGSQNDGYFYLDDLTPPGYNFNLAQELIINIFPDTLHYTYPPYCAGNTTMNFREGSFEDGSGPSKNYPENANCSWLIDPQGSDDSISQIILNYSKFQLSPFAFLKIYGGATTSDPLLRSYASTSMPVADTFACNKLLVTFTGNGSSAPGWLVTYTTKIPVWCSQIQTITEDTAELSDGSLRFNYYNKTNCQWRIKPEHQEGRPLTLYFTSFDTETDKDILEIHDLADQNPSHYLAKLSGTYQTPYLPDSVTSPSGTMFLIFTSNASVTANGWDLYYPQRKHLGVNDHSGIGDLTVFPNPADKGVTIHFKTRQSDNVSLELMNVQGSSMFSETKKTGTGDFITSIDISAFPKGIYILRIKTDNYLASEKLIIN